MLCKCSIKTFLKVKFKQEIKIVRHKHSNILLFKPEEKVHNFQW